MLVNRYLASLPVLCLVLLASASLNAQTVLFEQNWDSYSLGDSIANDLGTGDYRWFAIPPAGNPAEGRSAIISGTSSKKFLAVKSVGFTEGQSLNPVLISNQITPSSSITLSSTVSTIISADMRLRNPDQTPTGSPYPIQEVWANGFSSGDGNKFGFGIYSTTQAFVKLPGLAQQWVTDSYAASGWYRFTLELNPQSKDIIVSLFSLDGEGAQTLVWDFSAKSIDKDYEYLAQSISSYRYTVSKPTGTTYGTADFGDFSITQVPEPSTVAALMGCGAIGLALLVRRRRRVG